MLGPHGKAAYEAQGGKQDGEHEADPGKGGGCGAFLALGNHKQNGEGQQRGDHDADEEG